MKTSIVIASSTICAMNTIRNDVPSVFTFSFFVAPRVRATAYIKPTAGMSSTNILAAVENVVRTENLLSLMGRNRDELSKKLTDKQPGTLEKYDEVMNEMRSLAKVEAFSYGFRLGVRLMIEVGVPLAKETT